MNVLDLFSGIGGFSLGLERAGMTTVAFCEIEPFCQKVLRKHWPSVPIFEDVRKLNAEEITGPVDLICGGYPCQPFSFAGKRRGKADDRHLWPEFVRLIRQFKPRWVICENVAGHINMGLDDVLSDLEREGYSWESFVIPACAVGHRQRRDRVWVLSYSMQRFEQVGRDATRMWRQPEQVSRHLVGENETAPRVVRNFNGIPCGLDRIKSLGNAVVPQIPEIIGRAIMAVERGES